MNQFSGAGDFFGTYVEDTFGVFGILLITIVFFWIILKIIEAISKGATRVTGVDPKSEKGKSREFKIGITLFIAFIFFALFIAPQL